MTDISSSSIPFCAVYCAACCFANRLHSTSSIFGSCCTIIWLNPVIGDAASSVLLLVVIRVVIRDLVLVAFLFSGLNQGATA